MNGIDGFFLCRGHFTDPTEQTFIRKDRNRFWHLGDQSSWLHPFLQPGGFASFSNQENYNFLSSISDLTRPVICALLGVCFFSGRSHKNSSTPTVFGALLRWVEQPPANRADLQCVCSFRPVDGHLFEPGPDSGLKRLRVCRHGLLLIAAADSMLSSVCDANQLLILVADSRY